MVFCAAFKIYLDLVIILQFYLQNLPAIIPNEQHLSAWKAVKAGSLEQN